MSLQVDIHDKFIMNCTSQIRQSADLLSLSGTENGTIENKSETPRGRLQEEAKKTVRCLTVLKEYVAECDDDHAEERAILPHGRFVFSRLKQFIFRLICRDKKSWLVQWWKHLPSALSPNFFLWSHSHVRVTFVGYLISKGFSPGTLEFPKYLI